VDAVPTGITVRLVKPDGSPAVGATVALIPAGRVAEIYDSEAIDNDPSYERGVAGADGQVHFAKMSLPYLLVALDESGCAQADGATAGGSTVRLQPWGKIEGRLMIGSAPGDGREIFAVSETDGPYDPAQPSAWFRFSVASAMDGTFVIARVPPGKIEIGRSVSWSYAGHSASGISSRKHLSVQPGQTVHVTLGGTGRPVVGKLILSADIARQDPVFGICNLVREAPAPPLPVPDDVKNAPLAQRQKWYEQFIASPAGAAYDKAKASAQSIEDQLPLCIAADGAFRVEDVDSGSYTLYADVYANSEHGVHKKGDKIGRAEVHVDVPQIPGDRSDQPLKLSDISLEAFNPVPHVGDLAPDFSAPTLDGSSLKLADFRGKFVLLDFWATWCGSCVQQTPYLKSVYDEFASSGRLTMISLSLDDGPLEPSQYAHAHDLRWPQAFLGAKSPIARQYGVEGIPSIWLIGPDGKVIAKSFYSERIRPTVAKALGSAAE
jgi:peroxiredoxin